VKLLFITLYFPPEVGAPQNRIYELAIRLLEKGVDITVLTAMPNYPQMEIHKEYQNKKYVFENSERRQKEEPLEVQLTMENTESNGLGISLPGGKVEMYSFKQSSGLEYIGADNMGQVPKGQSTTLTSGRAFDVIGNRKVLNYDRQRKSEEAVIEIKVTNARNENVNVLLVEHINGDWIIKDESLNYQKKDASTIHFPLSLNAGETKNVYYTYRKEWK